MITFDKMPQASVKPSFLRWQQETPEENVASEHGYDWYFAIESTNKNVIGFVALCGEGLPIATTLEIVYVFPKFRGQGNTIKIRDALVNQKNVQALTIGRYVDNPEKLTKHLKAASQSGFDRHYVLGLVVGNTFDVISDVFLHRDSKPSVYAPPLRAISIEEFYHAKGNNK